MKEESTDNQQDVTTEESMEASELTTLKSNATLMGISFHPNIGLAKLQEKIQEKRIENDNIRQENITITEAQKAEKALVAAGNGKETAQQRKLRIRKEALRLIRLRVTTMNPVNAALKGVILAVCNSTIGTIKRYIPFNADQGWHVPYALYQQLLDKKFMTHYEVKTGNRTVKRHRLVPEYAIEIMPPLTAEELKDLQQRQIMADK